jgi:hypothetical protein
VLLINNLDDYFNEESIENDLSTSIAKTCALIFHSMNLCSRITKVNVSENYYMEKNLYFSKEKDIDMNI